jgi:hypothetical protein
MQPKTATEFNAGYLHNAPGVARLIGEFTARWSLAEFSLLMPIIRATGVTQEIAAALLASTSSTEAKIRTTKAIVHNSRISVTEKNEIKLAINKLSNLCEERNTISHHLWAISTEGDVYTFDHRKSHESKEFSSLRSEENLKDLCNRTVCAAEAICAASKSSWVNEETISALTL